MSEVNLRDQIIEDYKTLLAIGWLRADEDGNVSLVIGDENRPATISGKRLILPTREQMKNKNWENRIGFHPLRESYNLGISDVTAMLRDQYVMRLNATIGYALKELIGIAHDQANQKNLTTDQAEVLNCLQNVSDRTVRDFDDLLKKTKAKNDADQFIGIFIKRGGMVKGQTYGRAAIVNFPVYDALKRGDEKVNGVKFSVKDREMLVRLFEFLMPSLAVEEGFNQGISSKTAPFLEALIRATFGVVNELVESMQPYLPIVAMPEIFQFPENMGFWVEVFDSKDLAERMQRCIPNLSTGEEDEPKEEPKKSTAKSYNEGTILDNRSDSERRRDPIRAVEDVAKEEPKPRGGRMIMGAPAPMTPSGDSLGKSRPDLEHSTSATDRANVGISRAPRRDADLEREEQRRKRETEDRERRERDREEAEERKRRDEERRERNARYDREDRGRDRPDDRRRDDRRDDRDDRDRDPRDRLRDDRDPPRRSGDIFDDNPVLRANLRDEEDRGYRRGRDRYDDRDDRRGRVRDLRDRDPRDRYDDRYDDRRDRDDRYYRDDRRYRR